MNLFSIPAGVPFLAAIAAGWQSQAAHGSAGDALAASRGLILLPTRRAARALAEEFLRHGDGKPMLLPRIAALGALDEAPLALAGALTLLPAVEPAQRLAVLTRMILAMKGAAGAPRTADRAWMLAIELATLLDEAERAGIDLAARLPDATDGEHAEHWNRTVEFLKIVTVAWPGWLAENGLMNPAARQVALLTAQAAAWADHPPLYPVLIAGTTGSIQAVARLIGVVARMPRGAVVLPGLDTAAEDAVFDALDHVHPQHGLARLLGALDARRGDVRPWPHGKSPEIAGRPALLAHALLPAPAIGRWRDTPLPMQTEGMSRLLAADGGEEAAAIAMILRDTLEQPGARAALVTPDRALAARVAAELARYDVVADDSAGEKLADTPPAVFLRLLAAAVAEKLAPVPLLALLKHPFAAGGQAPSVTRDNARALERQGLRGPRPEPGLAGLRRIADRIEGEAGDGVRDLVARVERCLEPLLRLTASVVAAPADLLAVLVAAAEALATTDATEGPAVLWREEEGDALATRLAAVQAALPVLIDEPPSSLPGLLDAVLEGEVVRSRRALRGRGGTEHPRVFIWGLLEARLQSVDVMVLGGLAEGVWPPATDPGPWMSRPMRARVGLPSPEEQVGQAAHDFVMAACAARTVVLSCPRRRDGAPTVASRWLVRLEACLDGAGHALPVHPAAGWARLLDLPLGAPMAVRPPQPRPDVRWRPRRLNVTEVETWLRDPYAIYAKHILRLVKLKPLDESADHADYGTLVHGGLHAFLEAHHARWPVNAAAMLRDAMEKALKEKGLRDALSAWWRPRLGRIADWVATQEALRRSKTPPVEIGPELLGRWQLEDLDFILTGRADRIERRADGSLSLLDYKTGALPNDREVTEGLAPQLPLEAAMAADGAFGENFAGTAAELVYWHLTGGFQPGHAHALLKSDPEKLAALVAEVREKLPVLVRRFDDPTTPYLSQPVPGRAPRWSDYAQLARVAEWSSAEDEA